MTGFRYDAGPTAFLYHPDTFTLARHGFFGRAGGVSDGLYDSLNCGLGSDDDTKIVRANRGRVAAAMGLDLTQLAGLYQVHSPKCVNLTHPGPYTDRPQADAYVTALASSGLAILTADCLPVLFCDPKAGVIGAAHAGWRGAMAGVIEATVSAMQSLGATPDNIMMVIGPGIQQISYQVSPKLKVEVTARHETAETCFTTDPSAPEKWLFDLPGFALQRSKEAGLSQVYDCGLNTYDKDELFFSHRRATHRSEPDSGRLISVITQS
jgi:hypothetical protein